jgi:glycosyltransferase involved in cell wall biosynthesis
MSVGRSRVVVGMPVFNGGPALAKALESILAQSYGEFRLIVSDNASTDETMAICTSIAASDSRVTYVRQPTNIGADANFDFVLAQADSEYFMWAAADDTRSPDFLALNVQFLDTHSDYVGSTCRVRFAGGVYDPVAMGDESRAEDSSGERIIRYFKGWHANGRFYSLLRTSALLEAKRGVGRYLGSDWAVVVRLLAHGKLNRLDSGAVELGRGGTSQRKGFVTSFVRRPVHWVLPVLELSSCTMAAVQWQGLCVKLRVLCRLGVLNLRVALERWREALSRQ